MTTNRILCSVTLALTSFLALLQAQNTTASVLPAQLATSKKVFISYGGGPTTVAGYSGPDTRVYDQFYSDMKRWGHYELASTPSDAELAFEISFSSPLSGVNAFGPSGGPVTSSSGYDPHLRLAIIDVKTNITLWTVIEHIDNARLQSNRDKNFDRAMNALVNDVAKLAGTPPAISQTSGHGTASASK